MSGRSLRGVDICGGYESKADKYVEIHLHRTAFLSFFASLCKFVNGVDMCAIFRVQENWNAVIGATIDEVIWHS